METTKDLHKVKSGDYCKCDACGHIGYAYGTLIGYRVSHPWCQSCGVNSRLIKIDTNKR